MSNSELSATIANMMEVLNPGRKKRRTDLRSTLDIETRLKRRLSSETPDKESPDKRLKTSADLDVSSWLASPKETRRMRTDLLEARNHVTNLENRIQHMHGIRKELQTMFDNEIKSLQQQHVRDEKTIQELELQVQKIRKREQDLKEELETVQDDCTSNKLEYETRIQELESTIDELQNRVEECESEEQSQLSIVDADNTELSQALENAQKESEFHKQLIADLELRLLKATSSANDIEIKDQTIQKAHLKIKELEYTLESYGEWQLHSKMQQQKLASYPDLEKEVHRLRDEAKHLRDEIQNKLILEEQVHDLTTRLEHFRNQEKKVAALQVSNAQLEQIVDEWYTTAREILETPCADSALPRELRQTIEHLQQQEIAVTSQKIQLDSQLKSCQHELKLIKSDHEKSLKLNSDLQTIQQQHQILVHRLQKKLMLVSRERDSYRLQLDSYEKDLTININPGSQGAAHMQLSTQRERIDNLEKIVDGYRDMVANLETELHKIQPQLNTDNLVPIRSEQLLRLQDEIQRLQNENSRLTERCDELEIKLEEQLIGKDKVQGKIFHLKMNPLSKCLNEKETNIDKLHEEIDRLKRKIKNLEQGYETSKLSDSLCSTREVQALKEQLKSSETKIQRLKDFFKTSSQEMRDVCYMLFGYKITRSTNTLYSLSSMYAETPDDDLKFQLNPDGNPSMLETQFSNSVDDLVDLYLRRQSSIPAFLSTVTMELFNRSTRPFAV